MGNFITKQDGRSSKGVEKSDNSITVQGVTCKPYKQDGMTVIDIRPAGFLEESLPIELFSHLEVKKILICHGNLVRFLQTMTDTVPPNVIFEVFDRCDKNHPWVQEIDGKYFWKTCNIEVDQHGSVLLDLSCNALKGLPLNFSKCMKLKRLIVRDYEDGVLVGNCNETYNSLEELIITQGKPGEKTLVINIGDNSVRRFPSISFKDMEVETSSSPVHELDLCSGYGRPSFAEMVNLKKLFISAGGKKILPTGLEKLASLEELSIIDNPVNNDKELFKNLIRVKKLTLFNCGLIQFPDCLKAFPDVEELDSGRNGMSGDCPFVSNFQKLVKLSMDECELRRPPAGLEECCELQELDLHSNQMTGDDQIIIPKLGSLKKLDLSHCELEQIPAGLEECSELQELNLNGNEILGSGPVIFPKLGNLKKLDLSQCELEQIPAGLEEYSELQELNLNGNEMLVWESAIFQKLGNLKKLDLSQCGLEQIPAGLEECSELQELNLNGNKILGWEPVIFPKLENLKKLDLSQCGLEQIPAGLGRCSELQELNLHHNWKLGYNKVIIPKLRSLKKLDLSHCGIEQIPTGLSRCSELQELNLHHNWKLGYNKVIIPKLRSLKKLDLSYCNLKWVPAGLRACSELQELDFHGNGHLGSKAEKELSVVFKLQKLRKLVYHEELYTRSEGVWLKEERPLKYRMHSDTDDTEEELDEEDGSGSPEIIADSFEARSFSLDLGESYSLARSFSLDLGESYSLDPLVEPVTLSKVETSKIACANSPDEGPLLETSKIAYVSKEGEPNARKSSQVKTSQTDSTSFEDQDKTELDPRNEHEEEQKEQDPVPKQIKFMIDEQGGGVAFSTASVFIQFPTQAVSESVVFTCTLVRHNDCPVKPRKGEVFCSSIIKIEPQRFIFEKPVTVLLSHSAVEKGAYTDYYDLTVQQLEQEQNDLKTKRISKSEGLSQDILSNFSYITKRLPVAQTTIQETSTLVVVTRIKYENIIVQPGRPFVYSKMFGNESKLKINFPKGSVEDKCCLRIKVFPATQLLDTRTRILDKPVCFPVVRVTGQDKEFLKPVKVELEYCNKHVNDMDENFLPVGQTLLFNSEYGVMLQSYKDAQGVYKWKNVTDGASGTLERVQKETVRITFCVKHFCSNFEMIKRHSQASLPGNEEIRVRCDESSVENLVAILWAVHEVKESGSCLKAIVAPLHMKAEMEKSFNVVGKACQENLACDVWVYFCVPLSQSDHLPLRNVSVRFRAGVESWVQNRFRCPPNLNSKDMYFLRLSCEKGTHFGDNCLDEVPITTVSEAKTPAMLELTEKLRTVDMKDPDPPLINVPKYKDMNINRVQWPDVNQKQVDVVLLTLEDEEFRAAYDTLQNPGTADSGHSLGPVYFSKIGKNNVALLKSSLGAIGIAGVQATCLDAIHHLNPKAIICPGLCFGMNKGKHQLGDVLVSTQIAFYGPTRNNKDGSTNPLGPIVECNARLRKLFDGGKVGWNYHVSEKINPRIYCGQIISGPQIIECCDRKKELKKLYPEALGGEMQGEGLYSICKCFDVPWIICKAIASWADGAKNEEWRLAAATVSLSYVEYILKNYYIPGEVNDAGNSTEKPNMVRNLDHKTREKICMKLNVMSPLRRDFRALGVLMGYKEDEIEVLGECDNPADALLQEWGTQQESTVDNLIRHLQELKRQDVIEILSEKTKHAKPKSENGCLKGGCNGERDCSGS